MAYHSNGGYSGDERESRSGDDRPDSDLGDKPVYLLEHLATFTVNKETGIVSPSDGMRRLLQLEKTTGIWSQKMQLCLDSQWVLIMDYETGKIIERFPASLIQEPTAFKSNDPMEMYNNILVFIVAGGSGSRSEMHIFQSQSISAVHLVEDLKQLRTGRAAQHRETIPPPPMKTSMSQSSNTREQFGGNGASLGLGVSGSSSAYHHESDSELGGINDETSSTSSDKYERDVTVLNHCFDDIEKFIARLQHAAAASRELERRRRNRKSKKKDPGEGLLTLRTRPPHEKEFIDIFAKFKLSFNLLAKLKAHIHDPNAPELVHFLFTPLALIVEASSDTYYESHLPARVINPLLTREAINLLINCVTSKETELWRSLGEAWTIPRDQWKGHIGSYHPVFFDGWSPDYPVVDELEHPTTPTNIKRRIETHHNFNAGAGDYDFEGPPTPNDKYSNHHQSMVGVGGSSAGVARDFSARSDISIDSIEHNGGPSGSNNGPNTSSPGASGLSNSVMQQQSNNNASPDQSTEAWIEDLQSRGAKIVQVTYPRTANNDKELTVVRGEYLEIIDDTRKWWKARNCRGQIAHVPHTIVTPYNYNDNGDVFNNPLYTQNYNKNLGRATDTVSERYTQSGENTSPTSALPTPNSAEWVRNKHIEKNRYSAPEIHDGNNEDNDSNKNASRNHNNKSQRHPSIISRLDFRSRLSNNSLKKQQQQQQQQQQLQLQQQQQQQQNLQKQKQHQKLLQQQEQQQKQHHQQNNNNNNIRNGNTNNPIPIMNGLTNSTTPPPPPPPPPPIPAPTTHVRTLPRSNTNNSMKSTNSSTGSEVQNEMQEELKHVLTLYRDKRRNLDIIKTPEIYIQQTSSPTEVEKWLRAKGFSDMVIKKMHGLNGNELFALKRDTLEDYCGHEEGKRLASQITIQRNVSGYKTARTSELQAILAKARKKTEQQQDP